MDQDTTEPIRNMAQMQGELRQLVETGTNLFNHKHYSFIFSNKDVDGLRFVGFDLQAGTSSVIYLREVNRCVKHLARQKPRIQSHETQSQRYLGGRFSRSLPEP